MSKKTVLSGASILGLVVSLILPAQPVTSAEFNVSATSASVSFQAINGQTQTPVSAFSLHYWNYAGGSGSITVDEVTATATKVFDDGRYWVEITPAGYDSGLTRTVYDLRVVNGAVTLSTSDGTPVTANQQGVYVLTLTPTNVRTVVRNPDGTPFVSDEDAWLDVELQKLQGDGHWSYRAWLWADNDIVAANVTEPGTYRMRINVYGDARFAQVIREFTIGTQVPTPQSPMSLGETLLNTPNFKFKVTFNSTVYGDQQFSVRPAGDLNENWHWTTPLTSPTENLPGIGSYLFSEPGDYVLKIRPWSVSGAVETSFNVTVDENLAPSIQGLTAIDGVYSLSLKTPNITIKPQGTVAGVLSNLANASLRISTVANPNVEVVGGSVSDPNSGTIPLYLEPDHYIMEIFPNADDFKLLNSKFNLRITRNLQNQDIVELTPFHSTTPINPTNGVYAVLVNEANVIGRVVEKVGASFVPLGSNQQEGKYVNISLEYFADGNWQWADNFAQANSVGLFGFFIPEPGSYRLRVEPQGFSGLSVTKFTPAALELTRGELSLTTNLGDLTVQAANLNLRVFDSEGSLVRNAGAELRQGNDFLDWFNTDSQGAVSMSLADGDYDLIIHPEWGSSGQSTRKQYSIRVTGGTGQVLNVPVAGDGVYELSLGSPNLRGLVLNPSGTSAIFEAEVVPVNELTGEEMWEYSARTGPDGGWGMQLPAGTYRVYAKSPWGQVEFGAGPKSAIFTVASNGTVSSSAAGFSATTIELRLSTPTFSGRVVTPGANPQPMSNAQVCLIRGNGDYNWNCSQTNSQGFWALSKPDGFTDFSVDSELVISEIFGERQFAELRLTGLSVENTLTNGAGYSDGASYSNIVLSPAAPNLIVTVKAGTSNAPRVWVSVDVDGYGWVGSGETNSVGEAKLFIPTDELLKGAMNVQASVENNAALSDTYASTRITESSVSSVTAPRRITLNLTEPNFWGTVLEPSSSNTVRNAWIEVFDNESGEWMGGASTNFGGEFSMTLQKPSSGIKVYRLQVNPAWNSGNNFSKSVYFATVDATGSVVNVTKGSIGGPSVSDSSGAYALSLAAPTVAGVVRDANGPVRDSWVVPLDNSVPSNPEYLWETGTNSRATGDFSMALPDGSYLLEANPPWQRSGTSKSARCNVTVGTVPVGTSGSVTQITSGDPACWDNQTRQVTLNLRSPNLKFKLVDSNNQPVRFANVGAGAGAWHTWTQSDSEGWVSLFIDAAEIITLNPQMTNGSSIDVYFWFDPPFGNGDMVRWECKSGDNKPVCSSVQPVVKGQQNGYLSTPLELTTPVQFAAPNTKIRVTKPGTTNPVAVGAGAWVGLFLNTSGSTTTCEGSREWIAGSVTDSLGFAAFNLTTAQISAGNYCLEVNPTWSERQLYAPAIYSVATHTLLTSVNSTFSVREPNLKVRIMEPTGNKSVRWSWVGIEEVNAGTYSSVRWIQGAGTDGRGVANLNLDAGKYFRLTAYPGPGATGSQVSCIIRTDSNGSIVNDVTGECSTGTLAGSELTIKLSAGNVSGAVKITNTNTVVPGAIVLAESSTGKAVTTVTGADGMYYLNLEDGNWTIKVFVVSRPGDPVQLLSDTTGVGIPVSGSKTQTLFVDSE